MFAHFGFTKPYVRLGSAKTNESDSYYLNHGYRIYYTGYTSYVLNELVLNIVYVSRKQEILDENR